MSHGDEASLDGGRLRHHREDPRAQDEDAVRTGRQPRARRALLARGHEARTQRLLCRVEHVHERTRLVIVERVERRDVLGRAAAAAHLGGARVQWEVAAALQDARGLRVAPALPAAREAAAGDARGRRAPRLTRRARFLYLAHRRRRREQLLLVLPERHRRAPRRAACAPGLLADDRERPDARERPRVAEPESAHLASDAGRQEAGALLRDRPSRRARARCARLERVELVRRVRGRAAPAEVSGERVEQVAEVDDPVDCAERAVVEEGLELEAKHAELEQTRQLPASLLHQVLERVHRALLRDLLVERLHTTRAH